MTLRAASAVIATSSLAALALAAGPATASPAPLKCSASVTAVRPADYSKEYVLVRTAGDAKVTASAHYRTTTRRHSAVAGADGRVSVLFRISDATPGYKVKVLVTVVRGARSGSCSTSFTPKR